jgi:hypothetical protein
MVSALFVSEKSIYKKLGIDCWDINRNAALYPGPNPVIVHPPCGQWGRLRSFAKVNLEEKNLAFIAIDFVRQYGGILEHPESSLLFDGKILPRPGCTDQYGGFSIKINQKWFGHPCEKKTYLYFYGIQKKDMVPYPITFDLPLIKDVTKLGREKRIHTPVNMALWLIANAKNCLA